MSHVRTCSRTTCREAAVATMTYGYDDATAVLGPLSPIADPSALDFCAEHANTVTVPRGWTMIRLADHFEEASPSESDLMALADAIRSTAHATPPAPAPAARTVRRPGMMAAADKAASGLARPASGRAPRLALVPDAGEEPGEGARPSESE